MKRPLLNGNGQQRNGFWASEGRCFNRSRMVKTGPGMSDGCVVNRLTWHGGLLPAKLCLQGTSGWHMHRCCVQCFQIMEVLPGKVPIPEVSESLTVARSQPEGWDLWEGKDADRPFFTTEMHSVSFLCAVVFDRWSVFLEIVYESIPERIGHIFVDIMYFIIMNTINMQAYLSFQFHFCSAQLFFYLVNFFIASIYVEFSCNTTKSA